MLQTTSDIEKFKSTELYQKMVRLVHDNAEITTKEKHSLENDFRNSLIGLREYLVSVSPLKCRELDYCITAIIGFRQCDFHHFFDISYSASRKYKSKLREKLPTHLYNDIFISNKS